MDKLYEHIENNHQAVKTSTNGNSINGNNNGNRQVKPLQAMRFSDIIAKEINWLWKPFLALGTFNLLEGEEGIGKTFLVCALASAIGHGAGLPGIPLEEHIESSNVLLISAEDSLSYVLKPRLESMNAPCEKIIAIEEPFTFDEEGSFRFSLVLAEYEPKLVVIDPLFSYTGKINLDRDSDIRSITDELKRLAEKYNCCILRIRHIGKSKGFGDARNAGLNGVGWRASARSALLIGKNPENDKQKALCQTKNNLAPKFDKSLGFEIVDGQFFWTGESQLTAETMLSTLRNESGEEKSEKSNAVDFLREALSDGEKYSKEIILDAKHNGISERTLIRAKSVLNVHSRKEGFKPTRWFWKLPEEYQECQDSHEDAQINKIGSVQANHSNKTSCDNNLTEDSQESTFEHLRGKVGNIIQHTTEDAQINKVGNLQANQTSKSSLNNGLAEDN